MSHIQNATALRVLLTGAGGQVGQALQREIPAGVELYAADHHMLDITQPQQVQSVFSLFQPDLLINAAAYTQVDLAQTEPAKAFAVNRDAVAHLAQVAQAAHVPVFHLSTDYVFDGSAKAPYTEADATNPLNVYGSSKLAGEQCLLAMHSRALVLRTSSVFSATHANFVTRIVQQAQTKSELHVTDGQISCPTPASELAETLWALVQLYRQNGDLPWGVLHYAGVPACSRYAWACEIIAAAQQHGILPHAVQVLPTQADSTNGALPGHAIRPAYSALDCGRIQTLLGIEPPSWMQVLHSMWQR